RRISVREVHEAPEGKKNAAASSAMIQSCRKRIGQVIVTASPSKMLQVPSGSRALSLVQLATLLLKGHSLFCRWRTATADIFSAGKPNTSDRGCVGTDTRLLCSIASMGPEHR